MTHPRAKPGFKRKQLAPESILLTTTPYWLSLSLRKPSLR